MEQVDETHIESGLSSALSPVYTGNDISRTGSTVALTANAVPPATDAPSRAPSIDEQPHQDPNKEDAQPPPGSVQQQPGNETPPAKPPLWKRRWFIITSVIGSCLGIALLFIVLYPVIRAIAQSIINATVLNIEDASIINPQNASFSLRLDGFASHAGIFSAKITFDQPVYVAWEEPGVKNPAPLGSFDLQPLYVRNKRAYINQTVTFNISDQTMFGRFTTVMITKQNFTWVLTSNNLQVAALKFPVAHGLTFKKYVTLNGINNFNGNVLLNDFQMPSNARNGINFIAVTQLRNPSPFQLALGTIVFDLSYQGLYIGTASASGVHLNTSVNIISLSGVLVQQSGAQNLSILSQLFTNYLNYQMVPVQAVGKSVILASDGSIISWLSDGLKSLTLNIPLQSQQPINPIRSIDIADMSLDFSPASPWSPLANSQHVTAGLMLPFGFPLSVLQIQNNLNLIGLDGNVIAGLATSLGPATSHISVLSSTDTEGSIGILLQNVHLSAPSGSQSNFAQFTTNITDQPKPVFYLIGQSYAVANLSVGQITLNPLKVNVSTSLSGLSGLKGYVNIVSGGVDVTGGTQSGLTLAINVTINNPSNLNLTVGDLTLDLYRNSSMIGTVTMPNLTLNMGINSISAQSTFAASSNPAGLETLDKFVSSQDVLLRIAGNNHSTNIASLSEAFSTLDINTTLPGLQSKLLDSASLVVLNTTGYQNNITHVSVSLANPFTAGLSITQVNSNVSYLGIHLGSISSSTAWTAVGKSATASPGLNMNLNMDPPSLFTVLRSLAGVAGLNTAQLDGIVQLGGYQYLPTSNSSSVVKRDIVRRDNMYTGFNLVTFVDTAFKNLQADVALVAGVTVGAYQTSLQYTQKAVPVQTDNTLNYILPVLASPIVQKIVDGSILAIDNLTITNPSQTSFGVQLHGSITNAGPFDGTIAFPNGLAIAWNGTTLGTMQMPVVNLTGDVGVTLNLGATFQVSSSTALTAFAQVLLTQPSFDWYISAQNLTVNAIGISVPQITFKTRMVTLKGMNNLKNGVTINTFDLPSNDPAGGITLTINSTATNPSQVGIALSSLGFQAFYGQTVLGPVGATNAFTLAPLSSVSLPMSGRLVPQSSSQGLADVSQVFNNFIHGKDSNITVQGLSAGDPSVIWLNQAIKSLQVATVLPNRGVLNIINSIAMNQLTLMFSQATQWNPPTSTDATTAGFGLPFAFPIDIVSMDETIGVSYNSDIFALLSVPHGPVQTDVLQRIIHLTFQDVPFATYSDKHTVFQQFLASTTMSKSQTMGFVGSANTDASTAVGLLSLTNITFNVQTTIAGLQGLNTAPTVITNLDVNHGYPNYLLINADTSLVNPSEITIGVGDVVFDLQFENTIIGTAVISNMTILPGNNSYVVGVHYSPQGNAVPVGQLMLENFLQGIVSATTISGSQSSTNIVSLQTALSQIMLSPVNIPPLHQNLISSASLVFPTNIVQTGVASVQFVLSNPFTASINLLKLTTAVATYETFLIGKINNLDLTSNPIHANGHNNITSSSEPFQFNLDPVNLINLLLTLSREKNINFGPLPGLFDTILQNPNQHLNITTSVDTNNPTCVSGNQFDINGAILAAMAGLQVTLSVQTSVMLDSYPTDLAFNQSHVPAVTDNTVLYLIGDIAAPIVQSLVSQASLTFSQANISNIANGGFDLSLQGSLTGTGPFDATISFTQPLTITWQGQDIATITLPDACMAANAGIPNYHTGGHLTITNQAGFTQFTTALLHGPSFDWTIFTNKLRVTALGTIFDNVILSKTITLKALNGLPGVTISNFMLPSNDPLGGIHIETDSSIPSPGQLGIDLGTVGFQAYFNGVSVGPLTGSNFFLAASATTLLHLSGRITPKTGNDLNTLGTLFTNYLQATNQTLTVQGDYVQPPGSSGSVVWLTTAFKTLTLQVTLPGQKYQIIRSIALEDFGITMVTSNEAYAPLASSNNTVAVYRNPFGFSLQVVQSAEHITLDDSNGPFATLDIASAAVSGGVSTGNDANLPLQFHNQPLTSTNNPSFQQLFQSVTDTKSATFGLSGSVDVTARTPIGDVPISGIGFSVTTTLGGINSFGGSAVLNNVSIVGSGGTGGNQYINAPLQTVLENPSNVSLSTVNVALPVEYNGVMIGRAAISPFDLVPGQNVIPTEFHYQPQNANDSVAQSFLSNYLVTSGTIPLTIKGDAASTPFSSLQPALEGVTLTTGVQALNANSIVVHVNAYISLSHALLTNMITIDFDLHNPLAADLKILMVQADGKVGGTTYAHFDFTFSNYVVPGHATVNSGTVTNVYLPRSALGSLGIIPLGKLDLYIGVTIQVGSGGYTVPWLQLVQLQVPTTYQIGL